MNNNDKKIKVELSPEEALMITEYIRILADVYQSIGRMEHKDIRDFRMVLEDKFRKGGSH